MTAGGAKAGFEGYPDVSKMQVAARIGQADFGIEMRLPWAVVDCTPKAGDTWRGTLCRNIFVTASGGDKFTSMSPLQSRFLEPENFTRLTFVGTALNAEQARVVSNEINADYRTSLVKTLLELATQGDEYMPAMQAAEMDEQYGVTAKELVREWRRLQRLADHEDRATLTELRLGLQRAANLAPRSYDLKYRVLLRQLVLD